MFNNTTNLRKMEADATQARTDIAKVATLLPQRTQSLAQDELCPLRDGLPDSAREILNENKEVAKARGGVLKEL